jgi:hypothetical protein
MQVLKQNFFILLSLQQGAAEKNLWFLINFIVYYTTQHYIFQAE